MDLETSFESSTIDEVDAACTGRFPDYWVSRGLVVIGVVIASIIPWPWLFLPLILVADIFIQNPPLPMEQDIHVREAVEMTHIFLKMQFDKLFRRKRKKAE